MAGNAERGGADTKSASGGGHDEAWPTVSVVFLAYNRRDELRTSLTKTFEELDYEPDLLDVIVVDNASTDGTTGMVSSEFPDVNVITRSVNNGVSGWNDGFAVASGDWVLALDDDCYLPADGLRRAIQAARAEHADLVSFGVMSSVEETHRFDTDEYLTGLLAFWGCAVLVQGEALQALGGFDPEIFIWGHELEFMLRFYDQGFRALYMADIVAVHMKAPNDWRGGPIPERPYRMNYRHWGYIAAKQLRPRDAAEALVALLVRNVRDGMRMDPVAYKGMADTVQGFVKGLKHRDPVRKEVSRTYRRNFETFSSPWWTSRTPLDMLHDVVGRRRRHGDLGRRDEWLAERSRFYPERRGALKL